MAGPVSGWKSAKTDAPGSAAGHIGTAKNAALRTACNVLKTKCPGVSRLCPGLNMQNGNTKRPIHAGFGAVSRLSRLSRHILVGVARNARNRRARRGRAVNIFASENDQARRPGRARGRACGSFLGFGYTAAKRRDYGLGTEKFRVFTFCLTKGGRVKVWRPWSLDRSPLSFRSGAKNGRGG